MRITTQEVKTIYTIELNFKDYADAREKSKDDVLALGAFEECKLEDTTVGTIREELETLQFRKTAKTLDYIVKKLGFDGVVNYGHYNKMKKSHVMQVYNYGDCING